MNIDMIMAGAMGSRAGTGGRTGLDLPMPLLMPGALRRLRRGRKGGKKGEVSLVHLPMRKKMEIRKGQRSGMSGKPKSDGAEPAGGGDQPSGSTGGDNAALDHADNTSSTPAQGHERVPGDGRKRQRVTKLSQTSVRLDAPVREEVERRAASVGLRPAEYLRNALQLAMGVLREIDATRLIATAAVRAVEPEDGDGDGTGNGTDSAGGKRSAKRSGKGARKP